MNLRIMNEAFKRNYSNVLVESVEPSYREQLRKALVMRSMQIVANGGNYKTLEVELQDVIKEFFPDNDWWEVTDCNIYMDLLSGSSPREVCDHIVDQIKDSCCDDNPTESSESKPINESIDDVKKIKQCIQSWVTGKYDAGGQNSAYFAKWLAESEAGLDWEKIAEVAYLMGYDVYKSSYGYFGDEDYLIVYPGHNPEIYASDVDDEYKAIWENEVENDLVKVESFNSKSINEVVSNPERTIAKVNKNLSRPVDNDLVRDLALVIENDREAYMRCLSPTIRMMKKRKANGSFDSTLAIKAFVNAVESSLKLPHFYQYHSYSMKNVGVPERYAVAQELLKRCMDEIEWEDADSANQSIQTN